MAYTDTIMEQLWEDLSATFGQEVAYSGSVTVPAITAVPGRTTHDGETQAAVSTTREELDWIVAAEDLGAEPRPGDRITTEDGRVYAVSYPDFQRSWDWVGQGRKLYRIHAHLTPE